ncbi:putative receptor-like protein kinase [Capsicum annuum]
MEKTSSSSFSLFTFLLISLHVISTSIAMNIRTDQSSLLALKAHITSDPNHILPANRSSSSTSVCNWIRITCGSRHQRVTVLNVSDLSFAKVESRFNNFNGEISPLFGGFKDLEMFSVENNSFGGFIPASISNMTNLEFLTLSFNNLEVGAIPDEIGHLYNLEYLRMERNKLTGSIPLSIFNISSLQTLYMSNNMLEGPLPREVGKLAMLDLLYLGYNNLKGTIPAEIGQLHNLKDLVMGVNKINWLNPFNYIQHVIT